MKISVIIPTYRPQGYLRECLESLDRQTLDRSEYEVLVVLNGEREPYYSEIQDELQGCSFRGELSYSPAAGVSNARNIGLDRARGGYICFIDDDDIVSPAYLEGLYRALAGHPGAIAVSNVATFIHRDDKTFGKDYIGLAFERFLKQQPTNSLFKKRKFLSSSCCKMIPKKVIGNTRFDVNVRLGEDSLFMFMVSNQIRDIKLSDAKAVYYIRIRPGSVSRSRSPFLSRISNKMYLINAYLKTYLKAYLKAYLKGSDRYSSGLSLSRIIATMINRNL